MKVLSIERRTYVRFLVLGGDDPDPVLVTSRDPKQELKFPRHCIGFVFYDMDVVSYEREEGQPPQEATSEYYNHSGFFFRYGRVLGTERPQDRIISGVISMLSSAMSQEEPRLAEIRCPDCRRGSGILPLGKDDLILEEVKAETGETDEDDSGPLGSLFHAMRGGRCRGKADAKQEPAAAPAE